MTSGGGGTADKRGYRFFVGDIHNHCGISYGIGELGTALENARAQLDFASVTGHAWWHDMPTGEAMAASRRVHHDGFERLAGQWDRVLEEINDCNDEGAFVTYPSFEWHSVAHGDRCIYYRDGAGPLLRSDSLTELRTELRRLRGSRIATFTIPHHPAYGRDNRGLKWDEIDEELEPVVEIISTHGSADLDVDRPYLLAIGPREYGGSLQQGLASVARFGVIGSTDNHAGFPGSYGFGRIGVWAGELTRRAIWDAITARRTVAMTGDRVELGFEGNGHFMGSTLPPTDRLELAGSVSASGAIDVIDLLQNGEVVDRWAVGRGGPFRRGRVRVSVWVGWGRPVDTFSWDLSLRVENGLLESVEPHLRGPLHVDPSANQDTATSRAGRCGRRDDGGVVLQTTTRGNPSSVENGSQGMTVEIEGSDETLLRLENPGMEPLSIRLGELHERTRSFNPLGYAGPAIQVGPAYPADQFEAAMHFVAEPATPGSYQLRVRLRNGEWAWSSPIWVR